MSRFHHINRHQLAAQAANLDFWLDEVRHALSVIDGYNARFDRLRSAQARYVSEHLTSEFHLDDPCCTKQAASPPRRVPHSELAFSRRSLCEATYLLLVRFHNEHLIPESTLRSACSALGIGVETRDLSPHP